MVVPMRSKLSKGLVYTRIRFFALSQIREILLLLPQPIAKFSLTSGQIRFSHLQESNISTHSKLQSKQSRLSRDGTIVASNDDSQKNNKPLTHRGGRLTTRPGIVSVGGIHNTCSKYCNTIKKQ